MYIHAGEEKILDKDCKGHFQTDPAGIQLHLTDILESFRDCLPLSAKLFLNSDLLQESDENISQLDTEIVTLLHTNVEASIVATTCWDTLDEIPSLSDDKLRPVCIPTNLKIAVATLK